MLFDLNFEGYKIYPNRDRSCGFSSLQMLKFPNLHV